MYVSLPTEVEVDEGVLSCLEDWESRAQGLTLWPEELIFLIKSLLFRLTKNAFTPYRYENELNQLGNPSKKIDILMFNRLHFSVRWLLSYSLA